jgi:hypothetical protein
MSERDVCISHLSEFGTISPVELSLVYRQIGTIYFEGRINFRTNTNKDKLCDFYSARNNTDRVTAAAGESNSNFYS